MSTIVLITGAARGIGKALVQTYLSRPNHTVIGTVRDTSSPTLQPLHSHPTAPGSKLLLFHVESTNPEDYGNLVPSIKAAGITHLDLVVSNAGIASPFGSPANVPIEAVTNVFDVNTLGTLLLFQATRDLLESSPGQPKWVSVSTLAASIGRAEELGTAIGVPYALSKVGVNWLTVAFHSSEKWLVAFAIHPGLVQTDMGNEGAQLMGLPEAPVTLEQATTRTMERIDGATREATSGKFWDIIEGTELVW